MTDPHIQVAMLTNRLADALQLLERLRGYATHRPECHLTEFDDSPVCFCSIQAHCEGCTCGLAALLANLPNSAVGLANPQDSLEGAAMPKVAQNQSWSKTDGISEDA